MSTYLYRVKRSFKPYQNEQNSVKDMGEKGKKPCNIYLKNSLKILFHYLQKAVLKFFPPNAQQKKKNEEGKLAKKEGKRESEKLKSRLLCHWLLNPILLSVLAQTSQANILHLNQRAANCTTFKWLYGKFKLL